MRVNAKNWHILKKLKAPVIAGLFVTSAVLIVVVLFVYKNVTDKTETSQTPKRDCTILDPSVVKNVKDSSDNIAYDKIKKSASTSNCTNVQDFSEMNDQQKYDQYKANTNLALAASKSGDVESAKKYANTALISYAAMSDEEKTTKKNLSELSNNILLSKGQKSE